MSKEIKPRKQIRFGINVLYIITLLFIITVLFFVYKYLNQIDSIKSLVFVLTVLISGLISICYIYLVTMKIKQHEIENVNKNEET